MTFDRSRESRSAANSSKQGMDCSLRGATLVLETTNCAIQSSAVLIFRKTTAAYALLDASQKPIRVQSVGLEMPWK